MKKLKADDNKPRFVYIDKDVGTVIAQFYDDKLGRSGKDRSDD